MFKKIITNAIYRYRTLTPQDYLFNQRDAMLVKTPHKKKLTPLEKANQGDALVSDQIQLIGVPKGKTIEPRKKIDTFETELVQGQKDLIFLSIDPSAYMARQRFMSHRCAMGKIQDYHLDGVNLIDPHTPITWEQTVVNLLTTDMVRQNKLPKQINYAKGSYAYSYPYIQSSEDKSIVHTNLIRQVSNQILDGKRTGYDLIDKVLYTGLMGKHKIMLGGMPETQFRMMLGKGLSIHQMRDIFRLVILKNRQLTIPLNTKSACESFLPHIFLLPKDLYMTAMLKESFQAAIQMLAFVGIEHWRPIQQYWVGPPHGINMSEATRIPEGFAGQTVEDLIQKQAMMDVLLQTRVWSRNYLSNPFPYLIEDITKVDKNQLQKYKTLFLKHYKKYSEFKNRQIKLIEEQKKLSISDKSTQIPEQIFNMKETLKDVPGLSHLKDKSPKSMRMNAK